MIDLKTTKPKYLYKYFKPLDQHFQALENRELYFPKPEKFDDPYDCQIQFPPKISARGLAILIGFGEEWRTTKQLPSPDKNKINAWAVKFQKQAELNLNQSTITEMSTLFALQRTLIGGIACFTERAEDTMMFSLYADHHKGFCLEFDTNFPMFDKALKVDYREEIPDFDMVSDLLEPLTSNNNSLVKLLTTKSPSWECEREWRITHNPGNDLVSYDSDSLTAVHLGLGLNDKNEQRIKKALEIEGSRTQLFRMKISPGDFRLVRHKIWLAQSKRRL